MPADSMDSACRGRRFQTKIASLIETTVRSTRTAAKTLQLQYECRYRGAAMTIRFLTLFILASISLPLTAQTLQVNPPSDLSSQNREAVLATRDQVSSQRRELIEKGMNLTHDEAKLFWPVYDAYAADMAKISD